MINKAKEKDRFLTEGLWSRFFPATQKYVVPMSLYRNCVLKACRGSFNCLCSSMRFEMQLLEQDCMATCQNGPFFTATFTPC